MRDQETLNDSTREASTRCFPLVPLSLFRIVRDTFIQCKTRIGGNGESIVNLVGEFPCSLCNFIERRERWTEARIENPVVLPFFFFFTLWRNKEKGATGGKRNPKRHSFLWFLLVFVSESFVRRMNLYGSKTWRLSPSTPSFQFGGRKNSDNRGAIVSSIPVFSRVYLRYIFEREIIVPLITESGVVENLSPFRSRNN